MTVSLGAISNNNYSKNIETVSSDEIVSEDYSEEDLDDEIEKLVEEAENEQETEKEFDKLPNNIKVQLVGTNSYMDSTLEEQEITIKYMFIDKKTVIINNITPDVEDDYQIYRIFGSYIISDIAGYGKLDELEIYNSGLEPDRKVDLYETYLNNKAIHDSSTSSVMEDDSLKDIYHKMIEIDKEENR